MDEFIGELTLDLDCRKTMPKISAGQFDKGRKYLIHITANEAAFTVSGSTVIIQGIHQDKSRFSATCSLDDEGNVILILTEDILSVSGFSYAKLILSDSNKNYSTQVFIIDVNGSYEGDIATDKNYSIVNDFMNRLMVLFSLESPSDMLNKYHCPTIINSETVPESAEWDDIIPTSYAGQTGEKGEIAFWNGVLWYLYNVATLGQTTYYHWDKVAVTEDLEAKMDLAPLNPTAEQIAAMAGGQLYGDTANHKGVLKTDGQYPYQNGQEFYDSYYINQHYKQLYDQIGISEVPILVQLGMSNIGDVGSTLLTAKGAYILFSTDLNPNGILNLTWRKTATYHIPVLSELPTGGRITSIVDGVATIDFYTGDLVEVNGKIYECSVNFPDGMVMPFNYGYEWREVDYYTKTDIDTMIGDIETLLSEV